MNEQIIEDIREKVYKNFVIYVDANDNGVDRVNEKDVAAVPTTLWSRVAKVNSMWWEENVDELALFYKAMEMAEEEFYQEVRGAFLGSIQTISMVREAFAKRYEVDPSGKIVLLQKYIPWQRALVEI